VEIQASDYRGATRDVPYQPRHFEPLEAAGFVVPFPCLTLEKQAASTKNKFADSIERDKRPV